MLRLILQSQEGHQIQLNVQPEDTFADLKEQYSDVHGGGLSESLEQLITDGAPVSQDTKIFDYITNSAPHEWFSGDQIEASHTNETQAIETEVLIKECCAQGCLSSEATCPGKPFFPLPTARERLAMCLIDIGRSDLYNQIVGLNSENRQKYFLCSNHFSPDYCLLPRLSTVEQLPTVSLLKPKNDRVGFNPKEQVMLIKDEENETREFHFVDTEAMLELLEKSIVEEHPGVLCRLCGESTTNHVYIFAAEGENENEYSLADKINSCLPVTVTMTDPLPKQICQSCESKLNTCHDLAQSSLKAEDKLTLLLRENKLCAPDNSKNHCPLCLDGTIHAVKESGIYRKNDFKIVDDDKERTTDRSPTTEKAVPTNKDHNDLSSNTEIHFSLLKNSVSTLPPKNSPLPVPEGKFPCSICSQNLNSVTEIFSHECPTKLRTAPYNCLICKNSSFQYAHELNVHHRQHGLVKGKFICEFCNYECEQLEAAMNHVNSCKPEIKNDHSNYQKPFQLHDNTAKFTTEPELEKRLTNIPKKLEKRRYSCFFCQKQFTRKGALQKHIISLHGNSMENPPVTKCYKCKDCNEAFAWQHEAETHINIKHLAPFVASDSHPIDIELSIEELNISSVYTCEFCERCFTIPSSLHDHREVEHGSVYEYSCNVCEKTFVSHRQLANHKSMQSHQNALDKRDIKQLHVCKYCDKTFLHYSNMSRHVAGHQEILPYLCRICNQNFENYQDIAIHRDISHPYQSTLHERSSSFFKCDYCEKEFGYEVALIKHIRIHTGERPHKCTICDKGFSQSSGLYAHMRMHSNLRPYSCTKCSKTFKVKGDRDNHVKKHSGNRPYTCEFCSKSFMTRHVYIQHRKIHTDERPYKCDVCSEAFRRSHVLTVHMRRHTGEKPHVCDMCPKTYRQRSDLVKHRKIQHGITITNSNTGFLNNPDDVSDDSLFKSNDNESGDTSFFVTL